MFVEMTEKSIEVAPFTFKSDSIFRIIIVLCIFHIITAKIHFNTTQLV